MSFARQERVERRSVPLAPLIDIMFILIIFFVTVGTFREEEQQIDVQLAATRTGQFVEPQRHDLIVNITAEGTVLIGERPFTLEQLGGVLRQVARDYPEMHVIVRGDKNVKYDRVLAVLDAAKAAGVTNARLATTRSEER